MNKEEMKKIIRVFPRKTNATPRDNMVRFWDPGLFDEADEVHISVTFSEDLDKAEELAKQWKIVAPVKIGGPATENCGGEFIPGMYLKKGYVITSRGCPNKCWFCDVWKKFKEIEELEIKDGWNVADDNLLACSENHIIEVFRMLKRQNKAAVFSGGFEAKRFREWHINLLKQIKVERIYFSYDMPADFEPLVIASKILKRAEIIKPTSHVARCYVLIGYLSDNPIRAEKRLTDVMKLGFMPMSMLYHDKGNPYEKEWKLFHREWANPIIVGYKMSKIC